MKKLTLLTILFCCLVLSLSAQVIATGDRIVGGTIGLGFTSFNSDTLSSSGSTHTGRNYFVLLSPSYGKAIKNNLVLGYVTSVGFTSSKSEDLRMQSFGKGSSWQVGGGVFLERFFPLGKDFSFSGRATFDVNYSSAKNTVGNTASSSISKTKFYGVGLNAVPSLNYSFSKKLLMQLYLNDFIGLNYRYGVNEFQPLGSPVVKQSLSNVDFTALFNSSKQLSNLHFGFRYIF